MGRLEHRLERLESRANEPWSLSRLLEWIQCPSTETPCGFVVDCIEALPIVQLPKGAN